MEEKINNQELAKAYQEESKDQGQAFVDKVRKAKIVHLILNTTSWVIKIKKTGDISSTRFNRIYQAECLYYL
jgi:hypothetical protein